MGKEPFVVTHSRTTHSPIPKKILVVSLSNLGDAILTYPAIGALRAAHPAAEFHVLASGRTRELFEGDPRFRRVWIWRKKGAFLERLILLAKLVACRYALVVDFRNSLIPLLMPWARRTPVLRLPAGLVAGRPAGDLHRAAAHLQLVRPFVKSSVRPEPVGLPVRPELVEGRKLAPNGLPYGPEEERQAAGWVEPGRPVVVMAPGSRSHLKRWPAERFAAVADRLAAERGAQILLIGGAEEKQISERVTRAMRKPARDLTGATTVRQLAALLARTDLLVTNDSACLHAAEAMKAPAVAIFGPTDERKYGPRDPRSVVIRRALICAPCERALCPYDHECMKWIGPDEVVAAASTILKGVHEFTSGQVHE